MQKHMYIINKVSLLILLSIAFVTKAMAQEDVEYRMEIGAGVGATAYQGDFNGGIFSGMQPAGAVVFRRIINPYTAIRLSGMYTAIKGSTDNVTTVYPDYMYTGYSFKGSLADISGTFEYNFFPYGTGRDYYGAKRITPFISIGLGMTIANCKKNVMNELTGQMEDVSNSVVTANLPIGVGVKYKVAPRLNLSLDWQMHFSFSDELDGVKDPYRISSSGMFKNTDCYSTLTLALTYSFSPKCPTCHKDK